MSDNEERSHSGLDAWIRHLQRLSSV